VIQPLRKSPATSGKLKLICFAGPRAARRGSVAAPQLTESSRPADASGYARYQKPISLVLPCADDRRNQGKANGWRRIKHRATVAYIITDRLIISLCVHIGPDRPTAVAGLDMASLAIHAQPSDIRKAELICSSFCASLPVKLLVYARMSCFQYCRTRFITSRCFYRKIISK